MQALYLDPFMHLVLRVSSILILYVALLITLLSVFDFTYFNVYNGIKHRWFRDPRLKPGHFDLLVQLQRDPLGAGGDGIRADRDGLKNR